ncbi:uncharacterized protein [Haliotis asinina]|uniref:uncharacterized protein n=1 Tax=Haliotis asinina TaxID=109174 RepID=UPI0035320A4F
MDTCQNPLCSKKLNEEGSVSGFIEIPIESQLQSMFKRPGFITSLVHKSRSRKRDEDTVEDICDGLQYKKLVADGILKSVYDLTLTFNTDGAKPFRSSKTSLWPIYLMINELPYAERRMPENMVLAGIWYGAKKPSMTGFLTPFMKTLKGLEQGFVACTPDGEVECRAILIASTCDLPARACVCAMNQYNGQSSCVKCLQTGKVVKVGKGHTRVFPPNMDCLDGPARSDNSVTRDALDAVRLKVPVNGIKGPSWFSYLTFFSFVHGTGIDYMHGVLLGVTKLMHSLWFASKHNCQVFSVAGFIDKVNRRLLQIKPPNYMSRLPRSLMDSDYWKASEWKYWLLFYAPTIMHDILMPEYYRHFLLLSESIFLLLQDSIKPSDIRHSKILLARFVAMFPVMYGESVMTLNVHQLLHLPDNVLNLGPLWCFSCFPFEDANGFLLKLFNGTQHIDKQIAHAVAVIQKMPELIPAIEKNSVAYDLYCRLKSKSKYKGTMLDPGIYLIGATKFLKQLSPEYAQAVKESVLSPFERLVTFKRVKVDGDVYFSEAYRRVLLRNSCTVLYESNSSHMYGIIETFLQVSPVCRCEDLSSCVCVTRNLAMIRCLEVSDNYMGVSYIKEVKSTNDKKIIAVNLKALKRKCVFVKVHDSDSAFLCNVPNVLEKD